MTITRETRVDTLDDKCTTLTEAERYAVEAGSYLALVHSAGSSSHEAGEKVVSFNTDPSDPNGYTTNTVVTDFTPDISGIYVFRRSIGVASDQTETFKYDSYYYDATSGKYYKTALTSITPDTVADYAGDNAKTDGNLSAVTVTYFKDVTETVTPTLTYDATNHKLVATIAGSSYISDTDLENYAKAYDDAIHDYQLALAERTRATAEDDTATDTLKDKLAALTAAEIAEANAEKAFKESLASYNATVSEYDAAKTDYDAAKAKVESLIDEIYTVNSDLILDVPSFLISGDAYLTYDGSGNYGTIYSETDTLVAKLETAYTNRDSSTDGEAFLADLKAWINSESITPDNYTGGGTFNVNTYSDVGDLVDLLSYSQLEEFRTWIDENTPSENHNKWLKEADYLIAKKAYQDKALEYKQAKAIYDELSTRISQVSPGLGYQRREAAKTLLGVDYSVGGAAAARDALLAENLDNAVDSLTKDSSLFNSATAVGSTNIDHNIFTEALGGGLFGTWYDAAIATAKAQLDLASELYTDAAAEYSAAHDIIINIKLANDVTVGGTAEKWQILPTTVPTTGDDANTATFYYTSILEGGETSSKLIDSVELDASVTQDMYKSFDFDLNVALKSAQITYADDNETILASSTTSELGKTATLTTPTDINTALTWS